MENQTIEVLEVEENKLILFLTYRNVRNRKRIFNNLNFQICLLILHCHWSYLT